MTAKNNNENAAMQTSTLENKDIMLNIMYSGSYIFDELGHEAINLYQADNGNFYIYAMHDGEIGDHNVETVLLVRRHGTKLVEILAKAPVAETLVERYNTAKYRGEDYTETDPKKRHCEYRKKEHEWQKGLIEQNNIKYGGRLLHEIFENNSTDSVDFYLTFRCEEIVKAKKPIYLTTDSNLKGEGYYFIEDCNFAGQKLRRFFSTGNEVLKNIITDEDNWGESVKTIQEEGHRLREKSFLDVIRKGYDELAYSNMLAYFFQKYPDLFCAFMSEKKIKLGPKFNIKREWNHIDLMIEDKDNIIVIENKIKSGINGIKKDENNAETNQLNTYYHVIDKYNKDEYNKAKTCRFFLLTPNYAKIDLDKYNLEIKWNQITYKDLYDFYKDKIQNADSYFIREFLLALEKQSQDIDNSLEEDLFERFLQAINPKP